MIRIIPCLRGSYQPARQTRDVDPNYVVFYNKLIGTIWIEERWGVEEKTFTKRSYGN